MYRPASSTPSRRNLKAENLKNQVSLWKRIKCFFVHTSQSPIILNLHFRKTPLGKSNNYHNAIVFQTLRFQNVFRSNENEKSAFSNSSGLKSVFEKFRFRDGLLWTVGLTVEISKAAFSNFSDAA